MRSSLHDLDELATSVRDQTSKELVLEAIAAYRGGALRAAVVATWIATVYDIISKARELEVQGDGTAAVLIKELDAARDNGNIRKQQELEAALLAKAKEDFEFLTPDEHRHLERLREDRHLCAHPAFASDSSLFTPSSEQVRAHLVHAISHLLAHPPVQGKAALDRVKTDLLQPSFPTERDRAVSFLRAKYLDRAKKGLVESLVAVCLKAVLRQTEPDLVGREHLMVLCLHAVQDSHVEVYRAQMSHWFPRLAEDLEDDALSRAFIITAADPASWDLLDEPTRVRLEGLARDYDVASDKEGAIINALSIDDLREPVLEALAKADEYDQARVIAATPRAELADRAVEVFLGAGGYRHAESLGNEVLLPMARFLSPEQIRRVLTGIPENGQIWYAAEMPEILSKFFDAAQGHLQTTGKEWQALMSFLVETAGKSDTHYAYPDLRVKMEGASLWPVAGEGAEGDADGQAE